MIYTENFYDGFTLNIFTDASIFRKGNDTTGCAGAIATNGPLESNIIDGNTRIIRNSTNNHSEINAISIGINLALKYKNMFPKINIFSDSKLCIYGLREWIFSWVNRTQGTTLIGTSGQEISNQEIIMEIIYKILDNNLSLTFFHQNGHVSINSYPSVMEAKKNFIELNRLRDDVDNNLIQVISNMNNYVDDMTRKMLKMNQLCFPSPTNDLIQFQYRPFDIEQYAKLIHII